MRIVIFSDVHGNVVALEAVLRHIAQEAAPDMIIVAGDLVADGPRPAEALALLRSIPDARFVLGNTDKDVVDQAGPAAQFAYGRLTSDDHEWLANLPFSLDISAESERDLLALPEHDLLVVHANPHNLYDPIQPTSGEGVLHPLLEGVDQQIIAFGHYHVPFVREVNEHTLVDVASVGLPRDGILRAVYATLTFEEHSWQIIHHRVEFDAEAVARDYTTVGFPNAAAAAQKLLKARY